MLLTPLIKYKGTPVNADLVTLIRDIYQMSELIPLYAPTLWL